MADKKHDNIVLFEMSSYTKPDIIETHGDDWILYGKKNQGFQDIIDAYNGSPTNESIINVYCQLLFGKGIAVNGQDEIIKELVEIFPKRDQRNCLNDFKKFGMFTWQILRAKGGQGKVAKILHLPMNKLGMKKADSKGRIKGVYYSDDWNDVHRNPPQFIPMFDGSLTHARMAKVVKPYQAGNFYFADPDYLAGLPYATLEAEIANFSVNHIKNGLSFGYIINFNNGSALTDEKKDEIETKVKQKLTGSTNAGKFIISFNDGKEVEVTVVPLEVNEAHSQWEFLSKESMTKLLTAHGVTSPLLFGLPSAGGFGSNADELDVSSKLLQDYQISPKQEIFIDELASIIELNGLETDLTFIPLRDSYKSTEEAKDDPTDDTIDDEELELSKNINGADFLLELGEDINYDEWDLIDDRRCDAINLNEQQLNTVFQFAKAPKASARKGSKQDTSLFKIRYKYTGSINPEREFCKRVMRANKVFAVEDLELASKRVVNAGFGVSGADTYDIFKYKGGVNCKHWWQRVIFLKKGNEQISVNDARKLILELDPEDRKDAKWKQNPSEVAQIASEANNHWRVN